MQVQLAADSACDTDQSHGFTLTERMTPAVLVNTSSDTCTGCESHAQGLSHQGTFRRLTTDSGVQPPATAPLEWK